MQPKIVLPVLQKIKNKKQFQVRNLYKKRKATKNQLANFGLNITEKAIMICMYFYDYQVNVN